MSSSINCQVFLARARRSGRPRSAPSPGHGAVQRQRSDREPYAGRTRARDYSVLPLATHDARRRTTWHRLVVWAGDQLCLATRTSAGHARATWCG